MKFRMRIRSIISLILIFVLLVSTTACSSEVTLPVLTDPNNPIVTENIETEATISEKVLTEIITSEIYLEEFIVAENKISELLLEENVITEVVLCKTIYIPEENIDEFAEHSQTAHLFGDTFDIKPVLKKVAIGTGIILTVTIVKKVGVPKEIASIVAAAADESLKSAGTGATIGSLFGAFTGAANVIDESGRSAAVMGFALATAGVIISIVSLVGAVPSGGTTGFGVAEGVHLAWAGVKVILATVGITYAARDTIKAFKSTDVSEINWNNIDWDAVGVSAVQTAIQNGADGYMWGAVYGVIDSAVESYYQKYATPYTKYQNRLKQVPKDGDKGHWTGKRGESDFVLNNPIELPDGTKITQIHYQNAVPDFSPYAVAEVKIPNMTKERYTKGGNFDQADEALAKQFNKMKYNEKTNWTSDDVKVYRENYPYKLTWHEMSNMETMQLVPFDVNDTFTHYGGVAEYKAMTGETGGNDFD